ncbi:hypothetical protein [Streptomyces sp. NPDC007905]
MTAVQTPPHAPALFGLPPDIAEARALAHGFAEEYVRPVAVE